MYLQVRKIEALPDFWRTKEPKVKDLLSERTPQVSEWESSEKVIDLMDGYGVKNIPVVNESRQFVGVISERDVLSVGMLIAADSLSPLREESPLQISARDLMDRNGIAVSPEDSAAMAASRMLEHQLDCVPVVEDSILVGLLTHTDFTRTFVSSQNESLNAA